MKTHFTRHSTRWFAFLCVLAVILAGCSARPTPVTPAISSTIQAPAIDTGVYWPTDGWRSATPEEQGMDSTKLAEMLEWVEEQRLDMHSLLVIRNGTIVSETYFGSYQQDTRHELYSCTKSFISTLTVIAIDKGFIKGTNQRVMDFFPGRTFANPDPGKDNLTLEDLLTMRSGLDWEEGDPAYREMYQSADWVKYVLDKPMVQPPGSLFNYCSGCSHLLSAILQQATGMGTGEFAEQNLFKPLGISNVRWDTDRTGIPIGGWGLQITPRDMAKLGYLYLQGGKWDGHQIISSDWVKTATQKHTESDSELGYGYQWWIYPSNGAYTALGLYGQTIFVIPEAAIIVVTTAAVDGHDSIFQLIDQYVLPAIKISE